MSSLSRSSSITKLTAKLNRQLEEPLIVASNCLPSWSEDLARLYPSSSPSRPGISSCSLHPSAMPDL